MKSRPYFERFSFRKVGIWLQWVFSWFHGNRSSLSRLNSLNIRIEIWRQFLSHFKPFRVIVRSSGNKSVSKSNHLDKNWTFHCNISSTERERFSLLYMKFSIQVLRKARVKCDPWFWHFFVFTNFFIRSLQFTSSSSSLLWTIKYEKCGNYLISWSCI